MEDPEPDRVCFGTGLSRNALVSPRSALHSDPKDPHTHNQPPLTSHSKGENTTTPTHTHKGEGKTTRPWGPVPWCAQHGRPYDDDEQRQRRVESKRPVVQRRAYGFKNAKAHERRGTQGQGGSWHIGDLTPGLVKPQNRPERIRTSATLQPRPKDRHYLLTGRCTPVGILVLSPTGFASGQDKPAPTVDPEPDRVCFGTVHQHTTRFWSTTASASSLEGSDGGS